jgi:hypothetical protein
MEPSNSLVEETNSREIPVHFFTAQKNQPDTYTVWPLMLRESTLQR